MFGWGGLDRKARQQPTTKTVVAETPAGTKASGAGMDMDSLKASATQKGSTNINFSKGLQQFKKSKNTINNQEFPELGDLGKKAEPAAVSKKDGTYMGNFGSSIATGKPKEQKPAEEVKEVK
jgi:hypothetical protein